MASKQFIADQGARQIETRVKTTLGYFTPQRCLLRHANGSGRKQGLNMAVEGIGEIDEELRKGMDGPGGYIDQIVSSSRKRGL